MCQWKFFVFTYSANTSAKMAFIAAAMSFVAEGVRSVRVSSGASPLCRNFMVFLELDFFMVSFVLVDVLLARSNTFLLLRLFCCGPPYGGVFQFFFFFGYKHSFLF